MNSFSEEKNEDENQDEAEDENQDEPESDEDEEADESDSDDEGTALDSGYNTPGDGDGGDTVLDCWCFPIQLIHFRCTFAGYVRFFALDFIRVYVNIEIVLLLLVACRGNVKQTSPPTLPLECYIVWGVIREGGGSVFKFFIS